MYLKKRFAHVRLFAICGGLLLMAGVEARYGMAQSQPASVALSPEMKSLLRMDAPVVLLRHVTLFDGTGAPARHDQALLIDHGRIASVGPDAWVHAPETATVVDGTGKTLLPGLVGMHEHLFFPKTGAGMVLGAVLGKSAPRMYLAAGITTARTTGSIEPVTDLAIRRLIEKGQQAGPDLDVTGPYLDGQATNFLPNQVITSPEDARETVDYWSKRGVTSFKAYKYIQPDALRAAITAAHAHGFKITGHLCSVGFREAAEMGIDNLEHGLVMDSDLVPSAKSGVCPTKREVRAAVTSADIKGLQVQSLIHELIERHVAVTSTLAVAVDAADDQPSLESLASTKAALSPDSWNDYLAIRNRMEKSPEKQLSKVEVRKEMEFEREFVRQGGVLMAGADPTGVGDTVAGIADQHEMEQLIEAGFSATEAVRIFSLNGARYLGRDKEIGTIEKGKRADLLLLDGDFEHDPHAIEKPETVFKNGVAWDSAKLFESVAGMVGEE